MNYTKNFIAILLIFSTFFTAFAQDITLKTQAEVDAFDKSITTIKGDLAIGDYTGRNDIKNLDGLSNLTSIESNLSIENTSLQNLDDLSNLTTIGFALVIKNNSLLTDMGGLSNIKTLGGGLAIERNSSLESLDDLSNLTSIQRGDRVLFIQKNEALKNINGLSNLTSLGQISINYNSSLTNLDGLSNVTSVGGLLAVQGNTSLYDCCGIQPILSREGAVKGDIYINGNASSCDSKSDILFSDCSGEEVVLKTQAQVDAFDKRIPYCKGGIKIDGYESPDPIRNLAGLSNLSAAYNMSITNTSVANLDDLSNLNIIGNIMFIMTNPNLTNLDGLSNLKAVNGAIYINQNQRLGNCCAIQSALSTAMGTIIGDNAAGCRDESNILSSCNPAQPDEGEEVDVSNYKENLWQLTRWELADCRTNQIYKFAENGTVKNTGKDFGTYTLNDKILTLNPTGGAPKRYTISKMTTNVIHLIDASGTETIYGRRQHIEDKIIGTNWREQGGAHDQMRMKFVDDKNVELITIGSKGSKIAATYALSNGNKTLTITFSDPAEAKAQGFPAKLVLNVKTFNYMMMKLDGGDGVICFNRA